MPFHARGRRRNPRCPTPRQLGEYRRRLRRPGAYGRDDRCGVVWRRPTAGLLGGQEPELNDVQAYAGEPHLHAARERAVHQRVRLGRTLPRPCPITTTYATPVALEPDRRNAC